VDAETLAAAAPYVPRFRFLLEDISHETDEALRARAMTALARLALWCLRHAREPRVLVERLGAWTGLVREVRAAPDGTAALVLILRYIFAVSEPKEPKELVERLLAAMGDEGKEEIMTAAEQLEERGRQKGELAGRREMLLDLLRERFGPLPDATVARVGASDMAQLVVWTKRILTAPALDDIFREA
jgi:hypothetical protein